MAVMQDWMHMKDGMHMISDGGHMMIDGMHMKDGKGRTMGSQIMEGREANHNVDTNAESTHMRQTTTANKRPNVQQTQLNVEQ